MRLINVDALMERLGIAYDCRECDQDNSPYCTWKPDAVDVCQIIADAPTIEERKKGKWIDKSGGIECAWNYCSVCGEQAIDLYDFCPNCGADMRGTPDDQS
jgi:hypothetical protein